MLELARIFRSGMVLQRGRQIAVFGRASVGATVIVTLQGKSSSVKAGDSGDWKAFIGPLKASESETMTVVSGIDIITIDDVAVGEVWYLGGQSNMEFHMKFDMDLEEEKKICDDPYLRFFDYPEVSYPEQLFEDDYWKHYGFWRKADSNQLFRFSAVGYYFAKMLRKKLGVPIGLVGCNWMGTPICAWMDKECVRENGGSVYIEEYENALATLDMEEYEKKFRKDPNSYRVDQLADPIMNEVMFGTSIPELTKKLEKLGIEMPSPDSWGPLIGPKWNCRPAGLYESMVMPLVPYGIRGFLWYQGESDGDTHPDAYVTLFPALIRKYREIWGDENLPFLFVQIEGLDHWLNCSGEAYVQIRSIQQHVADTVENTGMAVVTDCGMQYDIHPKKKKPAGERLALQALNRVYGYSDLLCEAPRLKGIKVKGRDLVLKFDFAGEGLYVKELMPYGEKAPDTCGNWLRIFETDNELDPSSLSFSAEGDEVVISGYDFDPQKQYRAELAITGWHQVPVYSSADLPARPAVICTAD